MTDDRAASRMAAEKFLEAFAYADSLRIFPTFEHVDGRWRMVFETVKMVDSGEEDEKGYTVVKFVRENRFAVGETDDLTWDLESLEDVL